MPAGDPASDAPITVVVADRHPLIRRALSALIDVEPGFAVLGQSEDHDTTVEHVRILRPRVVLLEPAILGGRGLLHLPAVLRTSPRTRAVVLADEVSASLDTSARGLGAHGTIVKHAPPDELFGVLRRAVGLDLPPAPLAGSA